MPTAEAGIGRELVGFGRLLRERGLPVGPDQLVRYQRAVAVLDGADLEDLYWAGRACLLGGRGVDGVYDQAFAEHFLGRAGAGAGAGAGAPTAPPDPRATVPGAGDKAPAGRRPVERDRLVPPDDRRQPPDGDSAERVGGTASQLEVLRHKAFAAMTPQELATLGRLLRALRPKLPLRATRRTSPARNGSRLDLRRSVRRSLRTQGELVHRQWRRRRTELRTIVLLLDVSGSMAGNSRALLQFAYGLSAAGAPVEVLCFGTRLTRVTAALACRDPDVALERVAAAVADWDGGTRIGDSLRQFVTAYQRSGFLRRAVVVICSDGLERGDPALLGEQMARLSRLCYRLIWVNPLKGDPEFRPVSRGMRAALPHLDELVAGDTFDSLAQLAARLGRIHR